MKSLGLIVLFMSLLEPTTRHEQLRDDWGLAWLLLERGMPMIVRVPDRGVLRLRVRARGAGKVSVRAAGDLVTQRRLVTGTDPGAGFPGQQPSPMIELRVSVPDGGESYRVEVDKGAAWLAPSYVDAAGRSHRYELPIATSPPLVGFGQDTEPALALIPGPQETEEVPPLALVPPSDVQPEVSPTEDAPALVLPSNDAVTDPPLVALGDEKKSEEQAAEDFALDFSTAENAAKERPSERPTEPQADPEPRPRRPRGPTFVARLGKAMSGVFGRGLRYSLGGDAEVGLDRVGARATAELILPMLEERFSALAYMGYRPSSLRGVAVTGQGVALPLLIEAQQNDLPLGVALRWRSDRMRPMGVPLRLHVQGGLSWVRREQGLSLETLRASRREVVSAASHTRAGLGLGLSSRLGPLILEGTAGLDLGPATPVRLAEVAQADYPGFSGLLNLGARWRFGDAKLPTHLKALDRPKRP